MKKRIIKLIIFIIICIFIYNMMYLSYDDLNKDISERIETRADCFDLNIEKRVVKDNIEYFLVSYKHNDYNKYYGLFEYEKKPFNKYSFRGGNAEKATYGTSRFSEHDIENLEQTYIVYGYNPNKLISYFKFDANNTSITEDISNQEFFINIYNYNEPTRVTNPNFFNDKDVDITLELAFRYRKI